MHNPAENLGDTFSQRRRIAIVVTLGLLMALGPFTVDLYLPSFPALKDDLSIDDPQVQITLSATVIGFSLGQLLVGPVSDRVGRIRPLLAMTTLHVTCSILVALAPNVAFLTVMRGLQGIGSAGGAVVAMAMARDMFSGAALLKMLAWLTLINGMAPILAPLLGSWMVTVMDWRGVFWFLAGYGCVVIALVATLLIETRPPEERTRRGGLFDSYRTVLSDRQFVGVWIMAAASFAGLFCYVSTSSVLLQETYGLSAQGFGTVFAICSVGVLIGTQTGSRLGARIGPRKIVMFSTTVMILAAVALLVINSTTDQVWPLVPAIFFFTTGFGATMPASNVLGLENHRENSGVAASLMGALNMGLAAVVGPVIGRFDQSSAAPMASGMLICASLAAASLWLIVQPWRHAERS